MAFFSSSLTSASGSGDLIFPSRRRRRRSLSFYPMRALASALKMRHFLPPPPLVLSLPL